MPAAVSKTLDANEAVASVSYRLSETIAIYPITPSSPMAESCDEWRAMGRTNLWGAVPNIVQMQSEAGAAGAVHGMLHGGTLSTTYTASQGLLLMIPAMYKIAGELLPFVMHVTARTLATHALSIFGDHSDVMACRGTGFALLASNSVQEAQDLALIAHAASLKGRIPFLHFFDGFRTSHEVMKIEVIDERIIQEMIDGEAISRHRQRAMTPDKPTIRGTAQNPDVFFQAREACNPFYMALPTIVSQMMEQFASLTGRRYRLFDYAGSPEAEEVVIVMGSGAEVVEEYISWANARGKRLGVLKPRLFRPWSVTDFVAALPKTARCIAVLDRCKEPGAVYEPLHAEVIAALHEAADLDLLPHSLMPRVVGGRFGLSSKDFTPAMVKAVFDNLTAERPRNHFTIGITDDVTGLSLPFDATFDIEPDSVTRALFYGLGSDGTVGANKNSIKIIGEETPHHAQGYFVYDSKKSGSMTISHLRFGKDPIHSSYLIGQANFIGCHLEEFLMKFPILEKAAPNAVFLLNTSAERDQVWTRVPAEARRLIGERKIRCYGIDASRVAQEAGMGGRINTIMQTCFFALSGVLPREDAIEKIKHAIAKTYRTKGEDVVAKNWAAVDRTLANLYEFPPLDPAMVTVEMDATVPVEAPEFVQHVTAEILAGRGDLLPVSAFPPDGVWPTATAKWEKRNIAQEVPVWDTTLCIQCNKCVLACPHAAIRAKFYEPDLLAQAPPTFKSAPFKSKDFPNKAYTLQVAVEDCTGCTLCVRVCPATDKKDKTHKAINMAPQLPLRQAERENFDFFLSLPQMDRALARAEVKSSQFLEPLFEFSGACAGCGETPYLKLLTQLYGDRLIMANATGCSSIYGGNLP
ncbi:MAG: pyruvate:ferredoxin (flavodoxin) oxidoreductase, partial [Verrucomicrobiia bacterium]